mmetsp:Transcript_24648/g.18667  ORF Transcript_24648/g.18667 Transcript_24648/m.18667 type:complete len:112 (-) Transcript_24648:11-346(-)
MILTHIFFIVFGVLLLYRLVLDDTALPMLRVFGISLLQSSFVCSAFTSHLLHPTGFSILLFQSFVELREKSTLPKVAKPFHFLTLFRITMSSLKLFKHFLILKNLLLQIVQ